MTLKIKIREHLQVLPLRFSTVLSSKCKKFSIKYVALYSDWFFWNRSSLPVLNPNPGVLETVVKVRVELMHNVTSRSLVIW